MTASAQAASGLIIRAFSQPRIILTGSSRTNVLHQRRNAATDREILLRIRANLGFPLRTTEVHENPLPSFASMALLVRCSLCGRFVRSRSAEHGSPCPVRANARAFGSVGHPGWLLNCVKGKVSADTDDDDRKTSHQKYAQDQSSASSSCLSVELKGILLRCRRRRLLLQCAGADSCFFLGKPQTVVFFGPFEVDRPLAHSLKRPFHADRANIDMGQHRGDE